MNYFGHFHYLIQPLTSAECAVYDSGENHDQIKPSLKTDMISSETLRCRHISKGDDEEEEDDPIEKKKRHIALCDMYFGTRSPAIQ